MSKTKTEEQFDLEKELGIELKEGEKLSYQVLEELQDGKGDDDEQ